MEYATREQAQQAVSQLSNQNLMGRLVYVREVCGALTPPGARHHVNTRFRIVSRNRGSSVLPAVPVADLLEVLSGVCPEDSILDLLVPLEPPAAAAAAAAVRSMLPTFVPNPWSLCLLTT